MEEERRLCYVGITRAKEKVYLIYAQRRSLWGGRASNPPSRFLLDIPPQLVASPSAPGSAKKLDRRAAAHVLSRAEEVAPGDSRRRPRTELRAGDHVSHDMFGEGIVVNCQACAGDHEVTIAFKGDAGVKRFLLSLAPLEKLP